MILAWPYSFVVALETGQSSWTAIVDATRLSPDDDATRVSADLPVTIISRVRSDRVYYGPGLLRTGTTKGRSPATGPYPPD